MTLVLHDYIVLIAKQTAVKDGFTYEKAVIQLSCLNEDELHKLFGDATNITEALKEEIVRRNWKTPTVQTPSALPISGAEVKGE